MTSEALPAGAGIGRVALRVPDLDEAAAFYEDVVGLNRLDPDAVTDTAPAPATAPSSTSTSTPDDRVVLGTAGEPLLLLDAAPDAPRRKPTEAGLYHLAIRVPDRPALGAAIARLQDRDLLDGVADHGVSEAIYLRDPAGNGLELYVDRPKEAWPTVGDRVEMVTDQLDVDELVDLAASRDSAEPLPAGTTIGHVHLEVTDLDSTAEFYADALGMGLRQRMGEQALFLAAGDYHHHVGANTWRRRSEPAGESQGLAWFEVAVPSADALEDAGRRLEEAGFAVDRERGGNVLAVADPDEIDLRLRVDDAIAVPTGE